MISLDLFGDTLCSTLGAPLWREAPVSDSSGALGSSFSCCGADTPSRPPTRLRKCLFPGSVGRLATPDATGAGLDVWGSIPWSGEHTSSRFVGSGIGLADLSRDLGSGGLGRSFAASSPGSGLQDAFISSSASTPPSPISPVAGGPLVGPYGPNPYLHAGFITSTPVKPCSQVQF